MNTPNAYPVGAPAWLDLTTNDVAAAKDFYRELFGWTFTELGEDFGGYALIEQNGATLGGVMSSAGMECPEGGEVPSTWDVYLSAPDAEASASRAAEHGGQLLLGPDTAGDAGTFAVVLDPARAAVGIWQSGSTRGFELPLTPGTPVWFECMSMDFDTSLSFYRDVFSWNISWMGAADGSDGFRYLTHDTDAGPVAGLCDATAFFPAGTPSFWRVYFGVENTEDAVEKITALGGALIDGPADSPFGRFATVADPTGAQFQINQEPSAG